MKEPVYYRDPALESRLRRQVSRTINVRGFFPLTRERVERELRHIPRVRARQKRGQTAKSCYYVFLLPYDLQDSEDGLLDLTLEEDGDIQLSDYPSAREAERWFWNFGAVRAVERLWEWNDTAPVHCPARFLDRFRTAGGGDDLVREGKAVFNAEV